MFNDYANPVAASERPCQEPTIGNLWSSADQRHVAQAGASVQLRAMGNNGETAADAKNDFDTKKVLITLPSIRILRPLV
jgi:hypothetical protein